MNASQIDQLVEYMLEGFDSEKTPTPTALATHCLFDEQIYQKCRAPHGIDSQLIKWRDLFEAATAVFWGKFQIELLGGSLKGLHPSTAKWVRTTRRKYKTIN